MSAENMQTMRRSMEAFDLRHRDAWLALQHEDSEIIPSAGWPEAGPVQGREACWNFYSRVVEVFELQALGDTETTEVTDLGSDRVLVHQETPVRGKASGARVEFDYWVVITFRDGKIARDEWFESHAEALEAAGLSG